MKKIDNKDIKKLYEKIEKEIDIVREGLRQLPLSDKESKMLFKDANKALDNIEIGARCAYLTNHIETLLFIDDELFRLLEIIMKQIEEELGMSGKEIIEMVNETKPKKEKN